MLRVHSQPWKERFPTCLCFPIKILNPILKNPWTTYLVLWSWTCSRWKHCWTAVVEVPFPLQPLLFICFFSLSPSYAVLLPFFFFLLLFSPNNQSTQNQCSLPCPFPFVPRDPLKNILSELQTWCRFKGMATALLCPLCFCLLHGPSLSAELVPSTSN